MTEESKCNCGKTCCRQTLDDKSVRILTAMSEGCYSLECDCTECYEEEEKEDG